MPRNMSFSITTEQVRRREKTVTRRLGWWNLEPGEIVNAIEKGMGLKKGEKVKKLATIEVRMATAVRLDSMTKRECILEGFPDMRPRDFVRMFCETHKGCTPKTFVNRIMFNYVD
jgi:hypothetical protein